jgi:2-amino-4-hydroxy-6-hydroxymethyldihydropteridine diphosphokinase
MTRNPHQVFLGIGSNIDAEFHISGALECLKTFDVNMRTSKTYRSEAVGFHGPPFLNLVVGIRTHRRLSDLSLSLKEIEKNHGRTNPVEKYSSRTLDIDILTFDELVGLHDGIELPRPEIRLNAYVLRPFAELTPRLILPGSGYRLESIWQGFDHESQPLVETTVCW